MSCLYLHGTCITVITFPQAVWGLIDILEKFIDENGLSATKIYNVDETGLSAVQKCQKAAALKDRHQVNTITSAETCQCHGRLQLYNLIRN